MSDFLNDRLKTEVRSILDVYDKARERLGNTVSEIDVPTIVVIGF
jgi:hypothetical protein